MNITWIGSPNFDKKRKPIDRIVIHWFGSKGSTLKSTDNYFQKAGGVSATYAVEDAAIHQYVSEEHVPYSNGNYAMNQRSITIEMSANVARDASDKTYATAAALLADISKRRSIPLDRTHILRHSEVVATQCCGTVDVDRLIREALAIHNPIPMPIDTEMAKITKHDSRLKTAQDVLDKFTFYDGVISRKDEEIGQYKQAYDLLKEEAERLRLANYELDQKLADTVDDCQKHEHSTQDNKLIQIIVSVRDYVLQVITDVREQLRRSGKS